MSLADYAGQIVELRFRFVAGDDRYNHGLGWLVDNIVIGADTDEDGLVDAVEEQRDIIHFSNLKGNSVVPPHSNGEFFLRNLNVARMEGWGVHGLLKTDSINDVKVTLLAHRGGQLEEAPLIWKKSSGEWIGACSRSSPLDLALGLVLGSPKILGLDSSGATFAYPWDTGSVPYKEVQFEISADSCSWPENWRDAEDIILVIENYGATDVIVEEFQGAVKAGTDWRDSDSDNDAIPDGLEAGSRYESPISADADRDGIHESMDWDDSQPATIPGFGIGLTHSGGTSNLTFSVHEALALIAEVKVDSGGANVHARRDGAEWSFTVAGDTYRIVVTDVWGAELELVVRLDEGSQAPFVTEIGTTYRTGDRSFSGTLNPPDDIEAQEAFTDFQDMSNVASVVSSAANVLKGKPPIGPWGILASVALAHVHYSGSSHFEEEVRLVREGAVDSLVCKENVYTRHTFCVDHSVEVAQGPNAPTQAEIEVALQLGYPLNAEGNRLSWTSGTGDVKMMATHPARNLEVVVAASTWNEAALQEGTWPTLATPFEEFERARDAFYESMSYPMYEDSRSLTCLLECPLAMEGQLAEALWHDAEQGTSRSVRHVADNDPGFVSVPEGQAQALASITRSVSYGREWSNAYSELALGSEGMRAMAELSEAGYVAPTQLEYWLGTNADPESDVDYCAPPDDAERGCITFSAGADTRFATKLAVIGDGDDHAWSQAVDWTNGDQDVVAGKGIVDAKKHYWIGPKEPGASTTKQVQDLHELPTGRSAKAGIVYDEVHLGQPKVIVDVA